MKGTIQMARMAELRARVQETANRFRVAQAQLDACYRHPKEYRALREQRVRAYKQAAHAYQQAIRDVADRVSKIPSPGPVLGTYAR